MISFFDPARLTDLLWVLNLMLSGLLILLPASIAVAGYASLTARSDDRIRAWVQVITGIALTLWLLLPWHPDDPILRATNLSITLLTYGYVLLDWLREVWRSGVEPRWAHVTVMLLLLAALAVFAAMAVQLYPL